MRIVGKPSWPAAACLIGLTCGAAASACADELPPPTSASSNRAIAETPGIDRTTLTGALAPFRADGFAEGSTRSGKSSHLVAVQPDLPPEILGPPSFDAPAHSARPLFSLSEPSPPRTPGSAATPTAASGHDILVALSAVDARPVLPRPLGAGDWGAARDAVRAFYAGRSYAPAWTGGGRLTPAAVNALSRLAAAAEDGLDFPALALPDRAMSNATSAREAQADVALTQAIVAYAVEASGGRIDPARISGGISERASVVNPVSAIERVLAASDPAAELQNFNPPQKGYRDLRDKLAQIRGGNPGLAANPFPSGPTLKIGMIDPRVALIRTRFGLDRDTAAASSDALLYDARVASAVAGFQRANGLMGSGVLNPGTALALAGGDAARQESIVLANMEMWRWEPRDMGDERVEVNVPDFTLKLMKGERAVHSARVIVGKPDTPTPIFSNAIRYILVNPSWHVPQSIVKKEMLPKLAKDPDYLTRMGFEVVQKGESLLVRQPPGERNALGRILFMFPNEHAVYLHDTPARGLFAMARRAYSHGCIRVEQPLELGEIVMGGQANGWSQQRLRSLVGGAEQTIFLPLRIAIHIEYFTAFVDDSGDLQMRDDVYGHIRRVQVALGLPSQG